jgi:S-adenosyl-L-methionine hydrolase (adenosine-forming)
VSLVTLLSDFGTRDTYAGVVEGAILRVAPDARVLHLTHGVAPGDIAAGARALADAVPHVPVGIHVAVIDPGVGTDRRALVLRSADGRLFVGPDNGLLVAAAEHAGGIAAAHELTVPPGASPTFHGRDVFAPAAGRLALGDPPSALGESVDLAGLVRLTLPGPTVEFGLLRAPCVHVDRFGNCALAAAAAHLDGAGLVAGSAVAVAVRGLPRGAAQRGRTFADVPPGALVVLVDSAGAAALCINGGDAASELRLAIGDDVELRLPFD